MQHDELVLVEALQRGEPRACDQLVQQYAARVYSLALRLTKNPNEAEEVRQETFINACRAADTFEGRSALATWLYRIAINHCLNQTRRRRIARFFSLQGLGGGGQEGSGVREGAGDFDPADDGPDAETALLARERWQRTRERLDRLPENQRVVVLLARFEGLSGREIAETLGITEGAVESRLVRAMRRLVPQEETAAGVPVKEGGVG